MSEDFTRGAAEAARVLEECGMPQAARVVRARLIDRDANDASWVRGAPAGFAARLGPMIASRALAAMIRFPDRQSFVGASVTQLRDLSNVGGKTLDGLLQVQRWLKDVS